MHKNRLWTHFLGTPFKEHDPPCLVHLDLFPIWCHLSQTSVIPLTTKVSLHSGVFSLSCIFLMTYLVSLKTGITLCEQIFEGRMTQPKIRIFMTQEIRLQTFKWI